MSAWDKQEGICDAQNEKLQVFISFTIEFLQYQVRRVHVVPVTEASSVFVGVFEGEVCFQERTQMTPENLTDGTFDRSVMILIKMSACLKQHSHL